MFDWVLNEALPLDFSKVNIIPARKYSILYRSVHFIKNYLKSKFETLIDWKIDIWSVPTPPHEEINKLNLVIILTMIF